MAKMKEMSVVAEEACGWPNLTRLPNGEVICVYFNAPSHGLEEGDLVCAMSDDGGLNWKPRGVVAPHPEGGNRMHLAVGLAANGDLLAFSSGFFVEDEEFTGFAGQWLSRSTDGGRTWEVDEKPSIPEPCVGAIPFGRVIQLSDGRLAYTCYRSQGSGNPSETWIGFSEDDGKTWPSFSTFGEDDSNEPTILEVETARLLAAVRTHVDHHVKLCESKDGGKTWNDLGPLTLPMQHPADLIRIGDGLLLMTYGIRNRGLMAIGARLSKDDGKTWRPPWVIHQFGDESTDCGYPSTVMLDDEGTLLTAAYSDFDASLGEDADHYRVITFRWALKEWLDDKTLKSISDGKLLKS
jgi:hypothetical protein